MLTFSQFPKFHRPHLRTSNPIESSFAALRLRTDAGNRFKTVSNATAVIWKMLLVSQQRFRRLNAPELMQEAHDLAQYVNGLRVQELPWEAAA
jgi:transposase-like protein